MGTLDNLFSALGSITVNFVICNSFHFNRVVTIQRSEKQLSVCSI